MVKVLKEVLHQLQKINLHTDDLALYRANNLVTKALLQCQIGRLINYVEEQIANNELDQDDRGSPSE